MDRRRSGKHMSLRAHTFTLPLPLALAARASPCSLHIDIAMMAAKMCRRRIEILLAVGPRPIKFLQVLAVVGDRTPLCRTAYELEHGEVAGSVS